MRSSRVPDAFSVQLETVLDAAHRLATVLLRDRSAAEDAVQEAALKAWRKHGQLRGGAAGFRGWFLSIGKPTTRPDRPVQRARATAPPAAPHSALPRMRRVASSWRPSRVGTGPGRAKALPGLLGVTRRRDGGIGALWVRRAC
jgi:hypothetical protein